MRPILSRVDEGGSFSTKELDDEVSSVAELERHDVEGLATGCAA
jgi:hypothetical protein